MQVLADRWARPLRDLRISVTDRCNLRCTYCMPEEGCGGQYEFLPRGHLLSFEEVARVARAAVALGVAKVRVTGGEPLLRRDLPTLVRQLRGIPGIEDLALTTNGLLLPRLAGPLRAAGLDRVTVSLDSLDAETLRAICGRDIRPEHVLAGIAAAESAGFGAIKINAVVMRGINDREVLALARYFRGTGHVVRFIEYMDVGTRNGWRHDRVLPSREILKRLHACWPLRPLEPNYRGEVASRYAYLDGMGEVGFISSVTQPFCGGCTRLRLSADGRIYTCLFSGDGIDLRGPLREGATDADLRALLARVWRARDDRYSEERASCAPVRTARVEMNHVGG